MKWEETENRNRPITSGEIESVILKIPTDKSPRPDSFTGEFYQIFRGDLTCILLTLFQRNAEEETFPNLFYEASIKLIATPDKNYHEKRKSVANISNEYRCKNSLQNISKPNPTTDKKDHDQVHKDGSTYTN